MWTTSTRSSSSTSVKQHRHICSFCLYSTRAADSFCTLVPWPGRSSGLASPLRFLQLRHFAVAWLSWYRTATTADTPLQHPMRTPCRKGVLAFTLFRRPHFALRFLFALTRQRLCPCSSQSIGDGFVGVSKGNRIREERNARGRTGSRGGSRLTRVVRIVTKDR